MSNPVFNTPITNPFCLTAGLAASPTFADIDGDGDLDAFIGSFDGNTLFYKNTGAAGSPIFAAPVSKAFGTLTNVGSNASPTLADINDDGDLDAIVGNRAGDNLFFLNAGTAEIAAFPAPVANIFGLINVAPGATNASPVFADIDGDGDLDAFVGNGSGNILFYLNIGRVNSPSFFRPVTNPFGLTNAGFNANPAFADIDGDGDQDAFVGNLDGNTLFYQNTGTAGSPVFAAPVTNPFGLTDVGSNASPTFADIDGDGDQDAFVGNFDGNTLFYLNDTAPTATNLTQTVAYTEDTSAIIADIVITDPDANNTFTATVTMAAGNSSLGTLSTSSGHGESYAFGTGVWKVSGSKADVNAALAALAFVPAANSFANTSALVSITDGVAPAITGTITFNGTGVNDLPAGLPGITGIVEQGQNLSADTSGISDIDGLGSFAYVWKANGQTISGATDSTYTLKEAEVGKAITVAVKFIDAHGNAEKPLSFTAPVSVANVNDAPDGLPGITGIVEQGKNLSADTSDISDIDGLGNFSYVWKAGNEVISGATDSSYLLTQAEVGKAITVAVSYTDSHGTAEGSLTSSATVSVANSNDAPIGINDTVIAIEAGGIFNGTPGANPVGNVLTNDTDTDAGDSKTVTALSGGTIGSTTIGSFGSLILNADGSYVYTIDNSNIAVEALNERDALADIFTYTVSDSAGLSDTATLTVTILGTRDINSIIFGTGSADNLTGTAANELIFGQGSNDRIFGKKGADQILGGSGNDFIAGGDGADELFGDSGNDTLQGEAGDDRLRGGTGNDLFNGKMTGNDQYLGQLGSDTVDYSASKDAITVSLKTTAAQNVSTGSGNDTLISIENLIGSRFSDTLIGNAASNRLSGGDGNDTLTGGIGADRFIFNTATGITNIDTLTGFTHGEDIIELSAAIFTAYTGQVGQTVGLSANLRYNALTGLLAYDADGAGALSAIGIAVIGLSAHPAALGSEFLVIA